MRYLVLLLLIGCAGSEIRFRVDRTIAGGSGVSSSSFSTTGGGPQTPDTSSNTTFRHSGGDFTSYGVEFMLPLGAREIRIVNPGWGVMPSEGRPDSTTSPKSVTTPPEGTQDLRGGVGSESMLGESGGILEHLLENFERYILGLVLTLTGYLERKPIVAGLKKVMPKKKENE